MEMEVYVRNKEKREFIRTLLQFYIKELKLEASKFSLTVVQEKDMVKDMGFNAYVQNFGGKMLLLAIDSRIKQWDLIQPLAHEMVHVKQYAKGQLSVVPKKNGDFVHYWMGKKVVADYYDAPWEVEAFSRERLLANQIARLVPGAHK